MPWHIIVVLLSLVSIGTSINRPVYKIILKQKGYAQFLQYDVDTPPLREFTFCTWLRLHDLSGDQSIFTYVASGNNRVVRMWLEPGGHHLKISINGKVTSSTPVDIVKDVWRHVCLSYQSDYGAWALYLDSRLMSCEAAQSLYGFVLPGGGSVILGYGTADNGAPNGLEGEIFGANMILKSTIERNYTIRQDPMYEQKPFSQNKIKSNSKTINNIKYVILNDLKTEGINENLKKIKLPMNRTRNFIQFRTPVASFEHDVGLGMKKKSTSKDISSEKEILDFSEFDKNQKPDNKSQINFWSIVNQAGHSGKFKKQYKLSAEQSGSGTQDLPTISEYETPPPPESPNQNFTAKHLGRARLPVPESIYKLNEDLQSSHRSSNKPSQPSDYEIPPPPGDNTKVYGQWTSSKFAGNVLNYLKSINFRSKEPKKIPPTIPLTKISDNYPYSSEFKLTKLRPPLQFQRRSFIDHHSNHLDKRQAYTPQINVKIIENDLRSDILKKHAMTKPRVVEVTNRGEAIKNKENRFYRNVNRETSSEYSDNSKESTKQKSFNADSNLKNHKLFTDFDINKSNRFFSILPFLKSLEYFIEDSDNEGAGTKANNDMYTKSLSKGNKWHNVKSYSNDFTPRKINIVSESGETDINSKIIDVNKRHPSIKLKYKHENRKIVQEDDPSLVKGRELASEVSNQSNYNSDSISLLKYNHGFLPGHDEKIKKAERMNTNLKKKEKQNIPTGRNHFNKHIKIGNALNERHVFGANEEQKKQSFVGGVETIPDINRYRSDTENANEKVPPSLGPRVCKNVEFYDRVLYVQPDGTIDMSHILSPLRIKNVAVEFIVNNYKKCSLDDSVIRKSSILFIDWSRTPVRLFGGAYPKKTTDLCGFF